MFVATKLCGLMDKEPVDTPICDVVQAAGDSRENVFNAIETTWNGAGHFQFDPIPHYLGGETPGRYPSFEQKYDGTHGMMFTQWGFDGHNWDKNDQCSYARLFTTSEGCNLPQEEMDCVGWVSTADPSTPYGPIDNSKSINCNETVPDSASGWCWCLKKDGVTAVKHAVKSARRNPIGVEFTCEDECKKPTYIPGISEIELAYTTADYSQGSPGGSDEQTGVLANGLGAQCSDGFFDVEHMPVGELRSTCVNLNSDLAWHHSNNRKPPPSSKLCIKRG